MHHLCSEKELRSLGKRPLRGRIPRLAFCLAFWRGESVYHVRNFTTRIFLPGSITVSKIFIIQLALEQTLGTGSYPAQKRPRSRVGVGVGNWGNDRWTNGSMDQWIDIKSNSIQITHSPRISIHPTLLLIRWSPLNEIKSITSLLPKHVPHPLSANNSLQPQHVESRKQSSGTDIRHLDLAL